MPSVQHFSVLDKKCMEKKKKTWILSEVTPFDLNSCTLPEDPSYPLSLSLSEEIFLLTYFSVRKSCGRALLGTNLFHSTKDLSVNKFLNLVSEIQRNPFLFSHISIFIHTRTSDEIETLWFQHCTDHNIMQKGNGKYFFINVNSSTKNVGIRIKKIYTVTV